MVPWQGSSAWQSKGLISPGSRVQIPPLPLHHRRKIATIAVTREPSAPTVSQALSVDALLRLSGEVSTKARRTRNRFKQRLAENLRDGFRAEGIPARVKSGWSRLHLQAENEDFIGPVTRTFGISSFSVLKGETSSELDAIVGVGVEAFSDRVKGRTYAVRARRSGTHPFTSLDVQRALGAALNPGATVDLTHPEVVVFVEVRGDRAYLYEDRVECAEGLPLGVQGRALALMSGGFDSPVAAWMALRRGVTLDYIFCNLGGNAYERMVVEVSKVLADKWSYGTWPRLHVVPFEGVVQAIRERVKPAWLQVILKRMMYRAASSIGEKIGVDALVTGESIGQVSSQTLKNLRAIDGASSLPVFRPLVGFHKNEIIARARTIGTAQVSSQVREYCNLVEHKPVTAGSPENAAAEEAAAGYVELEAAIADRHVHDLRRLRTETLAGASLYLSSVPDGAEVLDARSLPEFDDWHWPGARRWDAEELEQGFRQLNKDRTYVLCCAEGVRTAYVAEKMQRAGYEAYSFMGGAPRMRRLQGTAGTSSR